MDIEVITACAKRTTEATKGLGQRIIKGDKKHFFFLTVGLSQRGRLKL